MALVGIVSCCLITGSAHADVVFTLAQVVPGPISVGTTSVFNILISSNAGPVNIGGLALEINANHNLVGGTSDFFDPGFGNWGIFGSPNNSFGGSDALGKPLGATPTLLGTVTLSAMGAVPGTYSISLADLSVDGVPSSVIPTINSGPLSYTIAASGAAPEPASGFLLLAGACLIAPQCCRRSRAERSRKAR